MESIRLSEKNNSRQTLLNQTIHETTINVEKRTKVVHITLKISVTYL